MGRRLAWLFAALPARNRLAPIHGEQLVRAANPVGANYREAPRLAALKSEADRLVAIPVSLLHGRG